MTDGLDELTVIWYNANIRENASMVLDEVAIIPEPLDTWDVSTREEAKAAVRELAHIFHPQATLSEGDSTMVLFKSPTPLSQEHFLDAIAALQTHPYVKTVAPILYLTPQARAGRVIPSGEIIVGFPERYTQEQIHSIEAEYGLLRVDTLEKISPNVFVYTTNTGNALESIKIANQLYESGRVEDAGPNMIRRVGHRTLPNDTYFPRQWNLHNTGQDDGTPEEDVNIMEVWDEICQEHLCRGSLNEVIAIVDDAVDVTHEDLIQNALVGEGYHRN